MYRRILLGWAERLGKQTDDGRRHRALIAYLTSNNLSNTAAALRSELGLGEDVFDAATAKKYEGLLEKKWTSVVRLQKKVRYRFVRAPFYSAGAHEAVPLLLTTLFP